MKVAIDISPLTSGHQSRGVGYYLKGLLPELKKIKNLEIIEWDGGKNLPKVDLIHIPFFDLFYPTLPIKKLAPTVVTIHDVTPLKFPGQYPPGIRGKLVFLRQKIALRGVKMIITDSTASEKDIVNILKIPNKKVQVVYLAQSLEDKPVKEDIRLKYNLPEKYLINVGNISWNKNILAMCEACIQEKITLVLVGKSFLQTDQNHPELRSHKEFLEKYAGSPYIKRVGYVSDEDLVGLYHSSLGSLFVSFYEGFGIPVLDSQQLGVPVVTSNTSSLPEIAGEGAILVDPYSVSEIRSAISKLMLDPTLRQELINKGRQNIKRFSWPETARLTYEVYKKVLS
ncbi:hypothetical protein A2631_02925 [Candidatus Daviesbacteria bacterium RIFCSPHIGHO2_01_FULL_44_29]|uniref:Uncharacterized protein n=1 Tax=Candidatus Daviesbacteria bacterium RIFCSPHIGHO2_02_FULL_43_12 TaxID=1797776 RepID=A0A1F5KK73_9BACT|nr:MAG: hypothetical protein A2631_02925 [Candidatus Daviesbacteria bacterium RIFCSPHIGHO2_01_FULL_44_29]OGE40810.1 MAG: hypothetical protein A3E86_02425 [Candidatus Daviesbacteria bacterium RIFCSPHIGHO2_12_FULL_47_45]OGE41337.1 MAG: hypothetical protein A3D25_02320 [Candidatus Daviesbacteria bacterium RIFCSPHIGHO2_02_FULL_43_12]OGE69538.1 MAG: hypothetical protein A3B55_04060 [Candidatus Daviesbacteria bacterium RIFCSPLOWO2_01_FULL_43_15]